MSKKKQVKEASKITRMEWTKLSFDETNWTKDDTGLLADTGEKIIFQEWGEDKGGKFAHCLDARGKNRYFYPNEIKKIIPKKKRKYARRSLHG